MERFRARANYISAPSGAQRVGGREFHHVVQRVFPAPYAANYFHLKSAPVATMHRMEVLNGTAISEIADAVQQNERRSLFNTQQLGFVLIRCHGLNRPAAMREFEAVLLLQQSIKGLTTQILVNEIRANIVRDIRRYQSNGLAAPSIIPPCYPSESCPSRQQNRRPPSRVTPRLGGDCQSFTLPSSVDCDYDEGCDDTFVLSLI